MQRSGVNELLASRASESYDVRRFAVVVLADARVGDRERRHPAPVHECAIERARRCLQTEPIGCVPAIAPQHRPCDAQGRAVLDQSLEPPWELAFLIVAREAKCDVAFERLVRNEIGDVARRCSAPRSNEPALAMSRAPATGVVEGRVDGEVVLAVAVGLEEMHARGEPGTVHRVRGIHLASPGDDQELGRHGAARFCIGHRAVKESRDRSHGGVAVASVIAGDGAAVGEHVRTCEEAARGKRAIDRRLTPTAELDETGRERIECDHVHRERAHRARIGRRALLSVRVAERQAKRRRRLLFGTIDDDELRPRRRRLHEDDLGELDRLAPHDDALVSVQGHEIACVAEPVEHRVAPRVVFRVARFGRWRVHVGDERPFGERARQKPCARLRASRQTASPAPRSRRATRSRSLRRRRTAPG